MATSIKRHITFDPVLMSRAERRARQYGVNFPEYIRMLIVNDTKPVSEEPMEYIDDPEINREIGKSLEEYAQGKYKTLKSPKEIDEYLSKLKDEALSDSDDQ